MKNHCLIPVILLAAGICIPLAAAPPAALLDAGLDAFAAGHYTAALSSFERLLDCYPDYIQADKALFHSALSWFKLGKFAIACTQFARLPKRYPLSEYRHESVYWLGLSCYYRAEYTAAVSHFLTYAGKEEGKDHSVSAFYFLAQAYRKLGKAEESAETWKQLAAASTAQASPDGRAYITEALHTTGTRAFAAGHYAQALSCFARLLNEFPSSPYSFDSAFYLAECYYYLGDFSNALNRYETLHALFPKSPYREQVLYKIIDLLYRGKAFARCLGYLLIYDEEFPAGAFHSRLVRIKPHLLEMLFRYEEAVIAYEALLGEAVAAEQPPLLYNLGLVCVKTGAYKQAAHWFSLAAAASDPRVRAQALLKLAEVYSELKEYEKAIASLELYNEADAGPDAGEAGARTLALYYMKTHRLKSALEIWSSLLKDFPQSVYRDEYIFRRGLTSILLGDFSSALIDFQALIRNYPFSGYSLESWYNIGYIYSQQSEYVRALEYYTHLLAGITRGELWERSCLAAGIAHYNIGNYEQAIALFREALAGDTSGKWRYLAYSSLGNALLRVHGDEEAARCFRQAELVK